MQTQEMLQIMYVKKILGGSVREESQRLNDLVFLLTFSLEQLSLRFSSRPPVSDCNDKSHIHVISILANYIHVCMHRSFILRNRDWKRSINDLWCMRLQCTKPCKGTSVYTERDTKHFTGPP